MSKGCITGLREVWSGSVAPRSAGSINASRANARPMACAGARHAQKYATALSSGGLAAPARK